MKLGLSTFLLATTASTTNAFMPHQYDGFTAWALQSKDPSSVGTVVGGDAAVEVGTTKNTQQKKVSNSNNNNKKDKASYELKMKKNTGTVQHPKGPRFAAKMRRVAAQRRVEEKEQRKKRRMEQALKKKNNTQRKKDSDQKKKRKRNNNNKEKKKAASSDNDDVYNRIMVDMMFDLIDVNNDGGITNDELVHYLKEEAGIDNQSIRYLFTALDTNADGNVSREELQFAFTNYETPALYRAFGLGSQTTQELYMDAVKEIREGMVHDKNDNDDNKELPAPELLTKLADFIFNVIDEDKSGEIDVDELRTHFMDQQIMDQMIYDNDDEEEDDESSSSSSSNHNKTPASMDEKVESILEALDLNHDGVISREEMRQGFQQYDPRTLSEALGLPIL